MPRKTAKTRRLHQRRQIRLVVEYLKLVQQVLVGDHSHEAPAWALGGRAQIR